MIDPFYETEEPPEDLTDQELWEHDMHVIELLEQILKEAE